MARISKTRQHRKKLAASMLQARRITHGDEKATDDSAIEAEVVKEHELVVENIENTSQKFKALEVSGRRIVDMGHLFSVFLNPKSHTPFDCSISDMKVVNETRNGLASTFTLQCRMCQLTETICTESGHSSDISKSAVSAMMTTGGGYSQLEEISAVLDIPCMSQSTYNRHQNAVADSLQSLAYDSMAEAAKEEARLARECGDVGADGVPRIAVVVDGAWSKRSYRTNYNAKAGVACIIGYKTGKVLHIGVRQKYCSFCAFAAARSIEVAEHKCAKNWDQSSTAMEADIILQGFQQSLNLHGLRYTQLIADGDSSVYKAICTAMPYGPEILVRKIYCTNHLMRNYCGRIREMTKKTSIPLPLRKIIVRNEGRFRKAVNAAIHVRRNQPEKSHNEKAELLKGDIMNAPHHILGDHAMCKDRGYFCDGVAKPAEENLVPDFVSEGVFQDLKRNAYLLALHSESLVHRITNNSAELYNSILAKMVGGKRLMLAFGIDYKARTAAATASLNSQGRLQERLQAKMSTRQPGRYLHKYVCRKLKRLRNAAIRRRDTQKRRPVVEKQGPDQHYGGDDAILPPMEPREVIVRTEAFLQRLHLNAAEISQIEEATRNQSSSEIWNVERRKRLTASMSGRICKLRDATPRDKLVKEISNPDFRGNAATAYGVASERLALDELERAIGCKVTPCGLWVDTADCYLGASPDGITDDGNIVEVKCPASAASMTVLEGIADGKIACCMYTDEGRIELHRNHNYYYQVQMQLHVTQRNYCYFGIYTSRDFAYEKVKRDDVFWENKMKEKLKCFYYDHLLPHLVYLEYKHEVLNQ